MASTTSTATLTSPKAEMRLSAAQADKGESSAAPPAHPPNLRQTSSGLRRQGSNSAVSTTTTHSNHSNGQSAHQSSHHGGHHVSHTHSHHPKRRQSSHSHAHHSHTSHGHGHGHGHTSTSSKGTSSRRQSEGEGGRRALAAGLHMATMETAKSKARSERPLAKTSRSDTHLPRLSRQTSNASNTSRASHAAHRSRSSSRSRPTATNKRQQSGESVELDEEGHEIGEADPEDEEWESGEEVEAARSKERGGRSRNKDEDPMTAALRRTVSDTAATAESSRTLSITEASAIVTSPEPLPDDRPGDSRPNPTRKMTGFAGPQLPTEPGVATPTHALNDPTHIMPLHQIQHQQSRRSLAALKDQARKASEISTPDVGAAPSAAPDHPVERQDSEASVEQLQHVKKGRGGAAPGGVVRTSSDDPRLPDTQDARKPTGDPSSSPHFPFPKMVDGHEVPQQSSSTAQQPAEVQPQQPRHRQASETGGRAGQPVLAHRPSFSSVRSVQSMRAPPHPLNSPTGYRHAQPHSGHGTGHASPVRDRRGPGMHHPPMAPPVISREAAIGSGWGGDSEQHASPTSPASTRTTSRADRGPPGPGQRDRRQPEPGSATVPRNSSFSSIQSLRSLRGIFLPASGTSGNASTSLSQSTSTAPRPSTPTRRKTALETISAASKMQSTSDPVAYHASLGHSTGTAETAHLISRFLPPKKGRRPVWEVPSTVTPEGELCIGLTNGDYREAHESLVHTMRTLGVSHPDPHHPQHHQHQPHQRPTTPGLSSLGVAPGTAARRALNRTSSYGYTNSILGMSTSSAASAASSGAGSGEESAVGGFRNKRGEMVVLKGGWNGKTAFELSVERCLAQRPQRGVMGM